MAAEPILYIKETKWSDKQLHHSHEDDAGYDIVSAERAVIPSGCGRTFRTDLYIAIPKGHVGIIKGRSGLSINYGIECCNAGVIDAGYRGELRVKLYNTNTDGVDYQVSKGDRIAQLLILPIVHPSIIPALDLPDGDRGNNGFGSTGK